MRLPLLIALLSAAHVACAATIAQDAAQQGDIEVRGNAGPRRAKRQCQRHRQDSCAPRGRVVADHELPRIRASGSGPGGVRCDGNRAGQIMAANSPCHELFLVRAQADLRNTRHLRSTDARVDRAHLRGSAHPAGILGLAAATATTRSRTTPWTWRRAFGCRTGSCARPCATICRRCCVRCAPVLRLHNARIPDYAERGAAAPA